MEEDMPGHWVVPAMAQHCGFSPAPAPMLAGMSITDHAQGMLVALLPSAASQP